MNSGSTHTYVLVTGAWHGEWVWRDVMPGLHARGHAATAPALTGLGERRHHGTADTDLSAHIGDVIAHIESEGLQSVTLVGWSYGGMVVAGVAARIPDRIRSLIYLDAFVPEDGVALIDYMPLEVRARLDELTNEGKPVPPVPLDVFGLTDPSLVEFVTPLLVHQPWRTFYEPAQVRPLPADIPMTYVYCTGYPATPIAPFSVFYEKFKADPRVRTVVMETGHHCMLSEPVKTIDILERFG
ncbi:alpha/beta fold hydrolase [Paraburkholderia solisilvae]|uniref:Haloalkane dehalogenase n=1 Tax=Paraburkholderia solisilvae TaxID=624376 RepID=A0A6J5E5L6_9BURK|nr:alpha/beta hydrolase [Paraburkholderia solisilvae]CAB3760405.1 Haloalkane dehalogenase [Paraburkholderia solisilvae]